VEAIAVSEHAALHALGERIERALADGKTYAEALRAYFDEERAALRADHRAGLPGPAIARRRTETVDAAVRHACGHWAAGKRLSRWCLAAIGGYGRCELSPCSDVDLVFLSSGQDEEAHHEFNERILHTLWDAGCEVGHAFRTVDQYLELASGDLPTETTLLEARYVAGNEGMFSTLRERAARELFESREAQFLARKIEERRERHARFGNTLYLQEPNVKESAGGLRDLHTVMWVVQALHGTMSFGRMRELGLLTLRQEKSLTHAFDFFLRVRNELHFLLGRSANVVELTHQPAIAAGLGIGAFRGASADEHLMRLYYFHARNVSLAVDLLLERLRRALAPAAPPEAAARPEVVADGFVAHDGTLAAAHPRVFRDDPSRLIEVFALAQERGLALHPDLQLLVRASLALLDGSVQRSERAAAFFWAILGRSGSVGPALRRMHELGVLGRYLPEFGKLTCLVQHDAFHRFTIDEHTLRSIEYLDAVAASAGSGLRLYRKLFGGLSRPSLLYLGVLLHDVGKPLGADHPTTGAALARRACERLGLSPAETAQVEFLVQHHLLLSHTAFRRDLSDAKVVSDVVETVRTAEALAQLLLLVSADILGTAPELWNEWKEALLWDLYGRCGTRLQRSAHAAATKRLARVRDKVALSLKGVLDERAIGALLEQLPDRLFEIFPLGYLTRLAGLPHELGERAFVSEWAWNKARRVWDVAVCTRDRHGLLACLTGAFAVEEVNILSAHIHTLKGGIVLDVFRVAALAGRTPIDRAFTAGVNRVFDEMLRQGTDVEELLARARAARRRKPGPVHPVEVHFNNTASDRSTVIEVMATDRVGLLHDMLRVLSDSGLDINSAVISTERHRVFDVFYVRDGRGRKVGDKRRQRTIRDRLRAAILREPPEAGRA
jgi:[protein-PII] uridylyltransferase